MALFDLIILLCIAISFMLLASIIVFDLLKSRSSYLPSYLACLLILSYVVSPFMMYNFSVGVHPYFKSDIRSVIDVFSLLCFIVLLFVLSFFTGFFMLGAGRHKVFISVNHRFREGRFVLCLFLISLFFLYMFIVSYGGIDYVLSNASRIRSGTDENKNYLGAVFKMFSYYLELVVFFCFARFITYGGLTRFCVFLAVVSVVLLKAFLDAGRGGLLNIFIGLIFVFILVRGRLPILSLCLLLPVFAFVVVYGKVLLMLLTAGGFESVSDGPSFFEKADFVLVEFSHQFLSLFPVVRDDLLGDRFYSDFFIWMLKPLKLLGVSGVDSISYYNTYNITGVWDSEIPPGPVALFLYNGGVFLVLLGGCFAGFFLRFVDRLIVNSTTVEGKVSSFLVASLAVFSIYIPFAYVNSDPALFVQWCLVYIILFFFLMVFRILTFRRFQ